MAQTLYATFNDIEQAEKAAGALLDHGVQKEDLSLIADAGRQHVRPNSHALDYNPPAGSSYEVTPVIAPGGFFPESPGSVVAGVTPGTATALNSDDYDAGRTDRYDTTNNQGVVDDDRTNAESVAKTGITTTTAEDAGTGAIKGTEIGLGLGILAGLATLVVPGVGLVIGGGALAAAVGAAALTTASGAAVGGVIGYLKDQGVNEVDAYKYHARINAGGALLAVSLPSHSIGLQETEMLLNKYGATDISSY
jgi:hypothetical protein